MRRSRHRRCSHQKVDLSAGKLVENAWCKRMVISLFVPSPFCLPHVCALNNHGGQRRQVRSVGLTVTICRMCTCIIYGGVHTPVSLFTARIHSHRSSTPSAWRLSGPTMCMVCWISAARSYDCCICGRCYKRMIFVICIDNPAALQTDIEDKFHIGDTEYVR